MDENHRLIVFYSVFSCVYISLKISILYVTGRMYEVGKYSFFPALFITFVAECVKYIVGNFYIVKRNNSGRSDERYILNVSKKNATRSRFKEVPKCMMVCAAAVVIYFIIIVLFGAPVFSKHEETFMLSLLLCVLTVCPACMNLGAAPVPGMLFGSTVGNDVLSAWLLQSMQFTLLGTWLGAFAIPLDWDRPWQVWPISCAMGALLGYLAANLISLLQMLPRLIRKTSSSVKASRKTR